MRNLWISFYKTVWYLQTLYGEYTPWGALVIDAEIQLKYGVSKMKVCAGDLVLINTYPLDKIPTSWNSDGEMNHLMGKVVEVDWAGADGRIKVYDEDWDYTWTFLSDHYTKYLSDSSKTDEEFREFIGFDTGGK